MAATFESGAAVNTAGSYTDEAMAYLHDEVMFDSVAGFVVDYTSVVEFPLACLYGTKRLHLNDQQNTD